MTFANLDCQRQFVHSSALGANILLYDWNFPRWLRSTAGFGKSLPGIFQDQKQALIYLGKNNLAPKPGTEGWNKEEVNSSHSLHQINITVPQWKDDTPWVRKPTLVLVSVYKQVLVSAHLSTMSKMVCCIQCLPYCTILVVFFRKFLKAPNTNFSA